MPNLINHPHWYAYQAYPELSFEQLRLSAEIMNLTRNSKPSKDILVFRKVDSNQPPEIVKESGLLPTYTGNNPNLSIDIDHHRLEDTSSPWTSTTTQYKKNLSHLEYKVRHRQFTYILIADRNKSVDSLTYYGIGRASYKLQRQLLAQRNDEREISILGKIPSERVFAWQDNTRNNVFTINPNFHLRYEPLITNYVMALTQTFNASLIRNFLFCK